MPPMDYPVLAENLMVAYTEIRLKHAHKLATVLPSSRVSRSILSMATICDKFFLPDNLQKALDTLDLSKIYPDQDTSSYDDTIVRNLLHYFKNSFFSWVTKETCLKCHSLDHMVMTGVSAAQVPNSDDCSSIEDWQCSACNTRVPFRRINNPARLLETRRGRCGEWACCFMLCLAAVLGDDSRIRYVWNHEDHVWCEYYSLSHERWIHLDPCEAAYDEPHLYCSNWGKRMSLVVGLGRHHAADLSAKYITPEKQISLKDIGTLQQQVAKTIAVVNAQHFLRALAALDTLDRRQKMLHLYHHVIVPAHRRHDHPTASTTKTASTYPVGRQSGGAEWTSARGENGQA